MNSINCAVFNAELAKGLGKKASDSDLEFFHRTHNGRIISFIYPKGFPEKINSLLQALHLADCILLNVDEIGPELGEIILAIDALGKDKGFILMSDYTDELLFKKVIKGTVVESFKHVERDEVLNALASEVISPINGNTLIDTDAMFNVRGVGTVALGFVKEGILKKHQSLKALPLNKDVLVKSIQKQDKDFDEACCSDRVGIALKGLTAEEFSRGLILTDNPQFFTGDEFQLTFERNPYWKGTLKQNRQLHIQCRLQITGCIIKSLDPLVVKTARKIAARKNEPIVLIDNESRPRIAGSGRIG